MGGVESSAFTLTIKEQDIGIRSSYKSTTSELARLIKENKGEIILITGAGISTSVLPTFRSQNNTGLWDILSCPLMKNADNDESLALAWKLTANVMVLKKNGGLKPSKAHQVIHDLQLNGHIRTVITQNVDSLHTFEDKTSQNVIDLHGTLQDFGFCSNCNSKRQVDMDFIMSKNIIPKCSKCCLLLTPSIAFFHDQISKTIRDRSKAAMDRCSLLILIGTHCSVDPALSLAQMAKKNGSLVAEINISDTVATNFADISLRGTADDILSEIEYYMY